MLSARLCGIFSLAMVVFVLLVGACDKAPPTETPPTQDASIEQPAERTPPDVRKPDAPPTKVCISARDCPNQDCVKGKCVKTDACSGHSECKLEQRCFEDRCITRCDMDTQCPKEHVCTDGLCHKPSWTPGKLPNDGKTTREALKVGLGVVRLDFPVGISMAGYGFRPGPRGPYAGSLGASEGIYDRFNVKVLIIDDGVEQIVLIRSPLVFTTDFMITQVAQRVIEKTGIDLTSKILMTSTHSHSAPARFWNLLPRLNFGAFGGGDFSPEVFRRIMNSFTDAILLAQKDLKPGKIGYSIDPDFDPAGAIFSDRRGENPSYKEPRLLVLRAERADGTPIAALVSFPMHGTISGNTMLTNDAAGGLEFKVQEKLEATEKKRIEVFFMQGPAGDVSPRGDKLGHRSTQQMQMLGALAAEHIATIFPKIKTSTSLPLEIINKRIPITYEKLGYKEGEFYSFVRGEKKPYRFGGFQCIAKGFPADSKEIHQDGKLGCIFSVEVLHGVSVPQFSKTRLTAAKIGDLVLTTFPGESTSHVARMLREGVAKGSGGDKLKDIIVLGYSQDHQLYIVDANDWWHGGYEASTTIWGPRMGTYLIDNAIELTLQLGTKEKEKNDTGILPQDFYQLDLTPNIPRLETPNAGTVTVQPPKTYQRLQNPMTFTVSGGFQGIDNPHVVLQRDEGGTFADVKGPGGRLYDEFDYRMTMTFVAKKDGNNLYTYAFQELESFPTGKYRFRIEGNKWEGGKRVPYTANTDAFELLPSDRLELYGIVSDGKEVKGWVKYPAGTNDVGKPFAAIKVAGHRLRSTLVRWEVGYPLPKDEKVDVSVTISQAGKDIETLKTDTISAYEVQDVPYIFSRAEDGKEVTRSLKALASGFSITPTTPLVAGTYQIKVSFTDAHGNTGTWGPKDVVVK